MLEMSNSWILILVILFVLMALAQILYYLIVFSRLAFYKAKPVSQKVQLPPVSIIIAARNEYKNLEKNLKLVLEQDYPNFEVIVVNDCSWDDSQKLLEYYQEQYSSLKVCQLIEQEKYPTGKKFALTIGIKAASHEHLFFSDADCIPASNQWLRLMQCDKRVLFGVS
jgi:cellulose synthase/poly-beta-1,6-N-acetylglucosamine synthase-like glycosyltransferase